MRILFAPMLILLSLNASASFAQICKVEVKDDSGLGVKSEVYLTEIVPNNRQGETNDEGYFELLEGCKKNILILAKPYNPFYHGGKRTCTDPDEIISIRVTQKDYLANLAWNAAKFEQAREWGKASMIYSEIASRSVDEDANVAASMKMIDLFAKHIKFDPQKDALVFDPSQKKYVISNELADAIRLYQANEGIHPTAVLDYETLANAADADVGKYLFGRNGE